MEQVSVAQWGPFIRLSTGAEIVNCQGKFACFIHFLINIACCIGSGFSELSTQIKKNAIKKCNMLSRSHVVTICPLNLAGGHGRYGC